MINYIIPPYLQNGAVIGVTCPAGAVKLDEMEPMFTQLREWGYTLRIGETVGSSYYKFSASDTIRLQELQSMLDDDQLKAILFGRGGYGVVRLIDQLDFTQFLRHPKWLLGYSDITCLLSHVHSRYNLASIHAHMGAGYREENQDVFSTLQINEMLRGMPTEYQIDPHPMNRTGTAKGKLVGGNLALLSDLIGTPSDLDTTGKILFIEDIGEYKYNIDRMMWQLLRAGKLDRLAGLLVGSFTNTLDNEIPFGLNEYEIVLEKVSSFSYPVCFGFPVGHQPMNYPLKVGVDYDLIVDENGVNLLDRSLV